MSDDWPSSRLFQELLRRAGEDVTGEFSRADLVLRTYLPPVQLVLRAGGSTPLDFTLHDDQHAFRVAERIVDILPPDVLARLSSYELALLLFASFLHDIGMSPQRDWVAVFHSYLLTGEWRLPSRADVPPNLPPPDEKERFEVWLVLNSTLAPGEANRKRVSVELLGEVEQCVSYYCRERHNDWSVAYIAAHMSEEPSLYPGWLKDLSDLCQSHHWGYDQLKSQRFAPRLIGSHGAFVHLRYLACLLRVADVIEFDPERTPPVLFQHRNIKPGSRIFWYRDQEIHWMINDARRISISARPPDARIHKAVLETIDAVEQELRLCRRLDDETDFQRYSGGYRLPHRWMLASNVHSDVHAREGTYVYIDGSFRPDTEKVLQLLAGMELYGDELVALREIAQNAYDAVRERIAYEQLACSDENANQAETGLLAAHSVTFEIREDGGRCWLCCRDTGIGMSRYLLENYFLVSGVTKRPDLVALERRCAKRGLRIYRSGRFGIGVLSYFLLADRVEVRTRRSNEGGDPDTAGWRFETEGVGSFGELRLDGEWSVGTEVRLRIRERLCSEGLGAFDSKVMGYLAHVLRRTPCKTTLHRVNASNISKMLSYGWVADAEQLRKILWSRLAWYKPGTENPIGAVESERWERILEQFWTAVRVDPVLQEENALGSVRVHLPYYTYLEGQSLVFFDLQPGVECAIKPLAFSDALIVTTVTLTSYCGILVSDESRFQDEYSYKKADSFGVLAPNLPLLIEIDVHGSTLGEISVDRNRFHLNERGVEWVNDAIERATAKAVQIVESWSHSRFTLINNRIAGIRQSTDLAWIVSPPGHGLSTKRIENAKYPLTVTSGLSPDLPPRFTVCGNSAEINIIPELHVETWQPGRASGGSDIHPIEADMAPDRVLLWPVRSRTVLVPVWDGPPRRKWHEGASFPPGWENLIGSSHSADFENRRVLNKNSSIVSLLTAEILEQAVASFQEVIADAARQNQLLDDAGLAAAWLVLALESLYRRGVEEFLASRPQFLRSLMSVLSRRTGNGDGSREWYWWSAGWHEGGLLILREDGVHKAVESAIIPTHLPWPTDEWLLEQV